MTTRIADRAFSGMCVLRIVHGSGAQFVPKFALLLEFGLRTVARCSGLGACPIDEIAMVVHLGF